MTVHDPHDTEDLTSSFALLSNTRTTLSTTYRATRDGFLAAAGQAIAELPPVPLPPRRWTLDGSHSGALFLCVPSETLESIPAEFQLDVRPTTVRIRTTTGSPHLIALYAELTDRLDECLEREGG